MHLCYIDESGTPEIPGTTSHFILAALSIPIHHWKTAETEIESIKSRFDLKDAEIHTGWILRKYPEQEGISGFELLSKQDRRSKVEQAFNQKIYKLRSSNNKNVLKQVAKTRKHTNPYIHLTFAERIKLVDEIAGCIGNWGFARLFAECIDKTYFDPSKTKKKIDEQAFEQVVSRFEKYLESSKVEGKNNFGLLIHDNNETIAKKHTALMKGFHANGTLWSEINHIIETPLFVNSELTSMIQMIDVCSYAIRRYLENKEDKLFDKVFQRCDTKGTAKVGMRHFTHAGCLCKICSTHKVI